MGIKIVNESSLKSVADAIRAKGGTSSTLEFPDEFVSAVEAISTGGGGGSTPVPAKEVNFRDYDGTVVYSYTPTEFAALSAMPDNPDHSGDAIPLTSQGWNWSFEKAQEYVAKYGRLEVGQMYATADGKTHVLIHLEKGRTSPILGCCPNGTVDVDWGDGTAHSTLTGTSVTSVKWTPTHNYAAPGDYDIVLTCSGTMGFYGSSSSNQYSGLLRYSSGVDTRNRVYQNAVQAVYCANSVTSVGTYAFQYCYGLSSIIIPDSVTSIDAYAFQYCYSLSSIIIPNSVSSVGTYTFRNCCSLSSITIPDNVTNIGTYAFSTCYSLSSIIIPDNVTSIGSSAFNSCYGLAELHFLPTTPPTVANTSVFSLLSTDCKIYVPAGSLEAYTTATNYPSSNTYTYIEE